MEQAFFKQDKPFHYLSSFRSKEAYFDATIVCDGKYFKVHRMILSAYSRVLEDLFNDASAGIRVLLVHPVILLPGVRKEHMEAVLEYIYNGQVNVDKSDLKIFLDTAKYLRTNGLEEINDISNNKVINNKICQINSMRDSKSINENYNTPDSVSHVSTSVDVGKEGNIATDQTCHSMESNLDCMIIDTVKSNDDNCTEIVRAESSHTLSLQPKKMKLDILSPPQTQFNTTFDSKNFAKQNNAVSFVNEPMSPNYDTKSPQELWEVSCPICSKLHFDKNSFINHLKSHTSQKKYQIPGNMQPLSCSKCPLQFISNTALAEHSKCHMGDSFGYTESHLMQEDIRNEARPMYPNRMFPHGEIRTPRQMQNFKAHDHLS